MTRDIATTRSFFRRGLVEQAADEGVELWFHREDELLAQPSLGASAFEAMLGGRVVADVALGFLGRVRGRHFHFVQPLSYFVQGPGELFFWLEGAPVEPLCVPALSWWQRAYPLLRDLRPARFETAHGAPRSLGRGSSEVLARTSRFARTGLAVWRLRWFAQLWGIGGGRSMLVLKALPDGPDRRERFPLKRVGFAALAALVDAVEADLPREETHEQDPIAFPEFAALVR